MGVVSPLTINIQFLVQLPTKVQSIRTCTLFSRNKNLFKCFVPPTSFSIISLPHFITKWNWRFTKFQITYTNILLLDAPFSSSLKGIEIRKQMQTVIRDQAEVFFPFSHGSMLVCQSLVITLNILSSCWCPLVKLELLHSAQHRPVSQVRERTLSRPPIGQFLSILFSHWQIPRTRAPLHHS